MSISRLLSITTQSHSLNQHSITLCPAPTALSPQSPHPHSPSPSSESTASIHTSDRFVDRSFCPESRNQASPPSSHLLPIVVRTVATVLGTRQCATDFP